MKSEVCDERGCRDCSRLKSCWHGIDEYREIPSIWWNSESATAIAEASWHHLAKWLSDAQMDSKVLQIHPKLILNCLQNDCKMTLNWTSKVKRPRRDFKLNENCPRLNPDWGQRVPWFLVDFEVTPKWFMDIYRYGWSMDIHGLPMESQLKFRMPFPIPRFQNAWAVRSL